VPREALPDFGGALIFCMIAATRRANRKEDVVVGTRQNWDGEPDRLNPLRFVLLLASVGGIVALIWWAYATGHIKHVETVPPPVTAPTSSTAPMSQ
jgi:hypothetical protein